jgi:hypothetical protein
VELLEETLVSVLENRPKACEVIVVHPHCYDDPYDLSDEVQFVESGHHQGLVDLLNLGIEAARAEVVHFLACGARVEEGWAEPAIGHFREPDVHSVSPAVLDPADPTRLVTAGVRYGGGGRCVLSGRRHRLSDQFQAGKNVLGPTLAAAFYRRRTLVRLDGLARSVGARLADLDAALTLGHLGCRTVFEPACRIVLDPSLVAPPMGTVKQGWCAERFFWRHACTQSWPDLLLAHPLVAAGELLVDLVRFRWPRLIGRAAGSVCAVQDYRHPDRIFELPPLAPTPDTNRESAPVTPLARLHTDTPPTVPLVPQSDTAETDPARRLRKAG